MTTAKKSAADKKAQKKQAAEKASAVHKTWKAAESIPPEQLLDKLGAFKQYDRNGLKASLDCCGPSSLSDAILQWAFDLTKLNMEEMYNLAWGWQDKKKHRELRDEKGRYLLAFDSESQQPLGFLLFRFTIEFEIPTFYVWEIQLEESCRGKGLGKYLMKLGEIIAVQNGIHDVVFCVQESNAAALAFYSKLGYTRDDRFEDPDLGSGYAMYHKNFRKK